MKKLCPFVVGQSCVEKDCAVWRLTATGDGYCGAGGPPMQMLQSGPLVEAPKVIGSAAVKAAVASMKGANTR